MQKKAKCEHRKSIMTPCYKEDGEIALKGGACIGCGKTSSECDIVHETAKLTEEQVIMAKKINRTINKFSLKMKKKMIDGMLNGKTGWDTLPAWQFIEGFNNQIDAIRNEQNIAEAAVNLANYAMMIEMRQ